MDTSLSPTKGNAIAANRSLQLARLGYELLDKKRNILIREMMQLIEKAKTIQKQIDVTFRTAYEALQNANITLGVIDDIALSVPEDFGLTVRYRSVMGVEIPNVVLEPREEKLPYGFLSTNSALDEAYINFINVKRLCAVLAEVENGVYRVAVAIKKTQKRANALKNIVIPRYENTIKYITEALEEKDREEFTRLKVIKNQKLSK